MPRDSSKGDPGHLADIDLAAADAVRYCQELTWEAFLVDDRTQRAVLHAIMVIGEATKRLSDALRSAHPEVPWGDMAGMRDRLIHGYDEINFQIVWSVVSNDLPKLRSQIAPLLPPPPSSGSLA